KFKPALKKAIEAIEKECIDKCEENSADYKKEFPHIHEAEKFGDGRSFRTTGYWQTEEENVQSKNFVRSLLALPCNKIGQNFFYDRYWLLKKEQMVVQGRIFDTQALHHCLDAQDKHSLEYMASIDTDQPYWKDEAKEPGEVEKYASNSEALWHYCCLDSSVTWELKYKYWAEIQRRGITQFYIDHYENMMEPLFEMTCHGIQTNEKARAELLESNQKRIKELAHMIFEKTGKRLFAVKKISPKALADYLYGDLKLPVQFKRRPGQKSTPTADEIAVRKAMLNYPQLISEVGDWVLECNKLAKQCDFLQAEQLDEDLIYGKDELDRSVVSKDRIRLIIRTFKERLPEIFPNRTNVPKTLIFAKDDSHAEDITEIVREEFGLGNEFCKKITYRTKEDPEKLIKSFRNSPMPRIAVTVDMIATGTDIKPLECIIFMRDVKTKNYFDQMKGRGTRTIKPDDLIAVTPDAKAKTHFVIIDAVGVCEHAMSDTHSLSKKPNVSFKALLDKAIDKNADTGDIESLVYRLSRLNQKLSQDDKDEITDVNNGKSLVDIQKTLLDGIDPDKRVEKAKEQFHTEEPSNDQIRTVSKQMIDEACKVFDSTKLRKTILDIKSKNEQIVDDVSIDELLEAGFLDKVQNIDKKTIENWSEFIEKNKDQITALDIIYSKPYKMREITFTDIKNLASAIEKPPYNLTPEIVWSAYSRLDKSKVKNNPVKMLTDLISLVRYSTGKEESLLPFSEIIDKKFEKWLVQQKSSGKQFTPEQKEWLVMIKDTIASSVSINLDALDDVPFNQKGGRVKFYELFGDDYEKILEELHEVLIHQ
ncbi:MAG: hypothetical protein IIC67_09835, partial [Thaumarchaeota archaeon]|nr:hypothetical protein [Nitrososphaerota archaeon]